MPLSGLVVTGRRLEALAPLEVVGIDADPAELPLGGRFRLRELALASCRAAGAARVSLIDAGNERSGRVARALDVWQRLETRAAASMVLVADHLVHADLGVLARRRADLGAAAALACMPTSEAGDHGWPRLAMDEGGRITAVGGPQDDLPLAWPGDLVVADGPLRALACAADDDATLLARLVATASVVGLDLWDEPTARRAWCTSPASIEAWYDAQMSLCRGACVAPPATLAALPRDTVRAPARLLGDAGQFPQVVDTLLADGVTVRGATVLRSVLGPGVVVDTGAEIEDSVLLAGARVGRGAAVRRAIVGPGVAIAADARVGWGETAVPGAVGLPSGLCLLGTPPTA